MFKIEKNVPLARSGGSKYPWKEMEIGDSFFVPCAPSEDPKKKRASVASIAKYGLGNGSYQTAIEGNGVRVWRTA